MRRRRPQITPTDVLAIAYRDGYTCHVCGDGWDPAEPWEIDHDIPVSRGGRHLISNLKLCHRKCNRDKSDA